MTSDAYPIPAVTAQTEETIKKSRFITLIAHTPGRENAQAFIEAVRQAHPDARHHCWAFIAGTPKDAQQWGFSDDGEPSGTAGKPILARLEGSGIGELCAVVVRYSGGIKLGTGGLVRAYGGGTGATLEVLDTIVKVPQSELHINCQYHQLNDIQHVLAQHGGSVIDTVYGETLTLHLSLPTQTLSMFKKHLHSHFKGQLCLPEDD
ncbi:YigZ family protein [Sansalvadorimonas verongulae]|nr:YigZ family protein [Sansalvadorimonas verongulae]